MATRVAEQRMTESAPASSSIPSSGRTLTPTFTLLSDIGVKYSTESIQMG